MEKCGSLVFGGSTSFSSLQSLDVSAARSVDSLMCCDNPVVDKCCSTLATILDEVAEIRIDAAEKFFPSLLLYEGCGE